MKGFIIGILIGFVIRGIVFTNCIEEATYTNEMTPKEYHVKIIECLDTYGIGI